MKQSKKTKVKGCACYGVNSIHPCFCSPFSNKKTKSVKSNIPKVTGVASYYDY